MPGQSWGGEGKGSDDENMGTCVWRGYTLHWQEEGKMKQEEACEDKEQQLQSPAARRCILYLLLFRLPDRNVIPRSAGNQ